ncbi:MULTISPECIES: hypothetical protein [Pseudomonadaceae]|nr:MULTISPECIES: hypothetical protein [Pseudomonadaceae]SQC68007.1 Uncharacterised protein [Pseudomonas aeruginosa]VEF16116.1 Uncharacterised protein [Stutzerimonas stutzeri]
MQIREMKHWGDFTPQYFRQTADYLCVFAERKRWRVFNDQQCLLCRI